MPAQHDIDAERRLWDAFAESTRDKALTGEPVLCWTQYAGHGPGAELLGSPATALEIGCGTGRALGCLLHQGVKVTGLDLSPVAIRHVTQRWESMGARLVCGEVLEHLAADDTAYDAVYSIFGAVWFTDPAKLLPLIARRLNPGGVLVFSQPPAIPGAYGPQGIYKGGFAGPAMYTYRYSYTPRVWAALLARAGFVDVEAAVRDAAEEGWVGTLVGRGRRAGWVEGGRCAAEWEGWPGEGGARMSEPQPAKGAQPAHGPRDARRPDAEGAPDPAQDPAPDGAPDPATERPADAERADLAAQAERVRREHARPRRPRRPAALLFEPGAPGDDPADRFFDLESMDDPRELLDRATELALAFRAAADRATEFQAMAAAQLADPRRFDRLTCDRIAERAGWTEDYARRMVEYGEDLIKNPGRRD